MNASDGSVGEMTVVVGDWRSAPGRAPENTHLFAVGDVHGCLAQLSAMLDHLRGRIEALRAEGAKVELVLLGDYVDRGPSSVGVLRMLQTIEARMDMPVVKLMGNHDLMMRDAVWLDPEPHVIESWLSATGRAILAELDLAMPRASDASLRAFNRQIREKLGPELIRMLNRLKRLHRAGDYLFVHGGVHPTRPIEEQVMDDLVWMREPFLSGVGWAQPFVVVHGHTISPPEMQPHRIAVDTGCFCTEVLTAVELERDRARFHQVTADPAMRAYSELFGPADRAAQ